MWENADLDLNIVIAVVISFSIIFYKTTQKPDPTTIIQQNISQITELADDYLYEGGEPDEPDQFEQTGQTSNLRLWRDVLYELIAPHIPALRTNYGDGIIYFIDPLNFPENRLHFSSITSNFEWFWAVIDLYSFRIWRNVESTFTGVINNIWAILLMYSTYHLYSETRHNAYHYQSNTTVVNRFFIQYNQQYQNMLWRVTGRSLTTRNLLETILRWARFWIGRFR
jgi:hypothetical protein